MYRYPGRVAVVAQLDLLECRDRRVSERMVSGRAFALGCSRSSGRAGLAGARRACHRLGRLSDRGTSIGDRSAKRAIAIRRRASRPPAAVTPGEGWMSPSRRTSGRRRGPCRHRLSRAPQRTRRGGFSRGLAGDAAVEASAAYVRLPGWAEARIGRDPDAGRAPEVIVNKAHGFSSRMRYCGKIGAGKAAGAADGQ
jgi:hypothetical protein